MSMFVTTRCLARGRMGRLMTALAAALAGPALATEFVYEGQLDDGGHSANGRYDLQLTAFADQTLGTATMVPLEFPDVVVSAGRFRLDFDLPSVQADSVWLQLAVREAGSNSEPSAIAGRTKAVAIPLIGACWSSIGDSASNPAVNFLGTTDAQPLVLRTRNAQSLRIEPSSVLSGAVPVTANMIAGSSANFVVAGARGATVAGGGILGDDPEVVNDGLNRVGDHYGSVGGGYANQAGDSIGTLLDRAYATVAGGTNNRAHAESSSIGGGIGNFVDSANGTVSGGAYNSARGTLNATIAGGSTNYVSDVGGVISGGALNNATGSYATIAGGNTNQAAGGLSFVSGGSQNCAGGESSWAGGRRAKVRPASAPPFSSACSLLPSYPGGVGHDGSFLWADNANVDWLSQGSNEFRVRSGGGVFFNSTQVVSNSWDLVVGTRSGGDADADLVLESRSGQLGQIYVTNTGGGMVFSATGSRFALGTGIDSTRYLNTAPGAYLSTGGVWTNASSRTLKEAFVAIDAEAVLERVLALGISRWQYKGSTEGTHIGPMAEDFHAAFATGSDNRAIGTVDADGVALAAIQGLYARMERDNEQLRAEIADLRAQMADRAE